MLTPLSTAQPTKLKMTHLACHMITTLILFDRLPALWALLCVSHYPSNIFTFI
jgi:hypothetical protein